MSMNYIGLTKLRFVSGHDCNRAESLREEHGFIRAVKPFQFGPASAAEVRFFISRAKPEPQALERKERRITRSDGTTKFVPFPDPFPLSAQLKWCPDTNRRSA
jgi:hypothetical protein